MAAEFRHIQRPLGGLLLIAAVAKLASWQEAVADWPDLSATFQLLGVECELALGLWLLFGRSTWLLWGASIGLFAAFSAVTFDRLQRSMPACGCFGELASIPPGAMLGLDVVLLLLHLVFRPRAPITATVEESQEQTVRRSIPLGVYVGVAVLLVAAGTAIWGLTAGTASRLLTVSSPSIEWRADESAGMREIDVTLVNRSATPLDVVGALAECSCVTTASLPATIPAQGEFQAKITVEFDPRVARFARRIDFVVSDAAATPPRIQRVSTFVKGHRLPAT